MTEAQTTARPTAGEAISLKRVLVGFDGSDGGRDALELARVVGAACGAAITVATVVPTPPLPIRYASLDEEPSEATPLFEEARRRLDGFEVGTQALGSDSPAMAMTLYAEREDADLVVVGSPHRGAIGRAIMGSVAHGLLHGAPCAVVVAQRGYADDRHEPFRTIAVAFDGTPESQAALEQAEALARATRGRIRVLTVVSEVAPLPAGMFATYPSTRPPEPDKLLTDAINSVDPALAAEGKRFDGWPPAKLAEACEDVDLLIAGSRRYGLLARTLLGSVSTELVHRAPCPVMVVPRP